MGNIRFIFISLVHKGLKISNIIKPLEYLGERHWCLGSLPVKGHMGHTMITNSIGK
jgi:hypothetical protein